MKGSLTRRVGKAPAASSFALQLEIHHPPPYRLHDINFAIAVLPDQRVLPFDAPIQSMQSRSPLLLQTLWKDCPAGNNIKCLAH